MRVARRAGVGVLIQAILALALAVGSSFLLRHAGTTAMFIVLFVLLTLLFFFALTLLRGILVASAFRRFEGPGGPARPGGRPRGPRGPGGPPNLGGVREPRRPFPPGMPPREAAAEPEATGG